MLEDGSEAQGFKPGDKVCLKPGIPNPKSRAAKLGLYNLDPEVGFWAAPPVHGCLIEEVIHPAEYAYKLPDSVGLAEGAMVEPLAISLQAAKRARIQVHPFARSVEAFEHAARLEPDIVKIQIEMPGS